MLTVQPLPGGSLNIMGEYASYGNQTVKIGTCEDMLYLRADQVREVKAQRGSVNPFTQADVIRFRFPFPQEDGTEPGAFADPFFTLGVSGVEVPEGVEHSNLQFTRNYPKQGGLLLSAPCPESAEGKASGLRYHYNGYSGKVQIAQQRLVNGQLVLICQCGSCGAAYRCESLSDAQPVIDSLLATAEHEDHLNRLANSRPDATQCQSRGDYYREIAKRIMDGYTKPNAWTRQEVAQEACA